MPIVFQQPEPVRADISQGAGAAEQWSRDFPTLQRQQATLAAIYEAAMRTRQQGIEGQAGRVQQAALANAQMQAQGEAQQFQAQQAAQQAALQRGHQESMQITGAGLQDQLAANQLTRGEQLRLERLKQGLSAVREQVDNGTLTAEEGQTLAVQLQTGINPLQQRQQRFQQQVQEFQYKQMQTQAARQDQLWTERQRFAASSLSQRTSVLIDDNDEERRVVMGMDGNIDWHATQLLQRQDQPTGRGGAAAGARPQQGDALRESTVDVARYLREAETEVRKEQETLPPADRIAEGAAQAQIRERARARIENHRALHGELNPAQQPTQEQRDRQDRQQLGREFNREFRDLLNSGQMPHGQFQEMRRQWVESRMRGRNPPPAEVEARPFDPQDRGNLNSAQLSVAQDFDGYRAAARAAPGRTAAQREQIMHNIDRAERLRARYGTNLNAMPTADRRTYNNLIAALMRLPPVRPAAPERRPPPSNQDAINQQLSGAVGSFMGP